MPVYSSRDCIVCGSEHPAGFQAAFHVEPGRAWTEVRPLEIHQGFRGILHGGLIAALMDDAMWYAAYSMDGFFGMTAELTVRYRRPVPVAALLRVEGEVVSSRGRLAETRAQVLLAGDTSGEPLATASAKFLRGPAGVRATLGPEEIRVREA
ncbi:MAG: PaaI family thioesterase [Clostridia bacterium]|nr:PaaI family thioesterase [Clostridia bacterium]